MKKKLKQNKNINQRSFYFEDYLRANKKIKYSKKKTIFKIEFTYYFSSFLFNISFFL